jgi:hypothetical protein
MEEPLLEAGADDCIRALAVICCLLSVTAELD